MLFYLLVSLGISAVDERLQQRREAQGALIWSGPKEHQNERFGSPHSRLRPARGRFRPSRLRWLKPAPSSGCGENLFSSVTNGLLTIAAIWAIYSLLSVLLPWLLNGVWNAESVRDWQRAARGLAGRLLRRHRRHMAADGLRDLSQRHLLAPRHRLRDALGRLRAGPVPERAPQASLFSRSSTPSSATG